MVPAGQHQKRRFPTIGFRGKLRGMRILAMLALASLLSALGGCTTPAPHGPVPFRPLGWGSYSAVAEPAQMVVKDQAAWDALWRRHVAGTGGPPSPPQVRFNQEMAVAVFLGRQKTAGHSIAVDRAEVLNGELRVYLRRQAPPPGSITAQVITAPFHFVAMPQLPLPVVFVDPGAATPGTVAP